MDRKRLEALVAKKGATKDQGTVDIDIAEDLAPECRYVDFLLMTSLKAGACSQLLRNMMVIYQADIPQRADGRNHLFDAEAICETISVLEGVSKVDFTKGPFRYEKGPLAGLYKKHFFQPSFMIENILVEIKREGAGIIHRKLSQHYGRGNYYGKPFDEKDAKLIAEAFSGDAIDRRARRRAHSRDGRLTGEHLIFAKGPKGVRYLYASFHGEDVRSLTESVGCCLADFPELAGTAPVFGCSTTPSDFTS